jgi:hypothetical protein
VLREPDIEGEVGLRFVQTLGLGLFEVELRVDSQAGVIGYFVWENGLDTRLTESPRIDLALYRPRLYIDFRLL